jgi:quercetin dioxygenase-like cupin family protein
VEPTTINAQESMNCRFAWQSQQARLFAIRVRLPANSTLPVHSHPDERVRTIISGTYYSAMGDKVDSSKLMAFPTGTFSHVPPKVWPFAETRDEEVVFQITGVGPAGIDFQNAADDPRYPQ